MLVVCICHRSDTYMTDEGLILHVQHYLQVVLKDLWQQNKIEKRS